MNFGYHEEHTSEISIGASISIREFVGMVKVVEEMSTVLRKQKGLATASRLV